MFSFDTEDDSKGNVKIVDFYDGVKHYTFVGVDCQEKAINFLTTREETEEKFFATNLEYDLCNIFGVFYTKLLTLYYIPFGGLIRAELGKIKFYDTLRSWEMSVKKAGDYLGLPKIDDQRFGVDRCKRDAEITHLLTSTMLERYDKIGLELKSTISSTAFNFWLKNFCDVPVSLAPEYREFLLGSMYGGRCEIFRHGFVNGPVYNYDINSSYPYAMKKAIFPNLKTVRYYNSLQALPKDLKSYVGVVSCSIEHESTYLGFLPYRIEGKLTFPVGKFSSVWTLNELACAVDCGAVKIKKIYYGVIFEPVHNPFNSFVDYIYNRRIGTDDKYMKYLYKKILNCVYGKFAQRGKLQVWRRGILKEYDRPPFWSNIIFSAVINSYARCELLAYLLQAEQSLCYCDTDGFVITSQVAAECLGKGIGKLSLEGSHKNGRFILPKLYTFDSDKVIKAKGIPQNLANAFVSKGRIVYEEPLSFKEAVRSGAKPNVWVKKHKELKAVYEKRIVLSDGRTKPKEVFDA